MVNLSIAATVFSHQEIVQDCLSYMFVCMIALLNLCRIPMIILLKIPGYELKDVI